MYDPKLGRFTQTDPITGNRATAHYVYARNNPVSLIDQLGLQEEPISVDVGPDYPRRVQLMTKKDIENRVGIKNPDSIVEVSEKPAVTTPKGEEYYSVTLDNNVKDGVVMIAREEAGDAGDVLTSSPRDLGNKLKRRVAESGSKIGRLNFYGHGGPGSMDLGDGDLSVETLKDLKEQHPDIADLFAKDAKIVCWGCSGGKGEAGDKFVQAVGQTFLEKRGGTVSAPRDPVQYTEFVGINSITAESDDWNTVEVQGVEDTEEK